MANRTSNSDNVSQLRADIDSGKTGDKVAFPDPAAAPLGTDAEAGGTPPATGEVATGHATAALSGARTAGLSRDQAGILAYVLVAGAACLGILAIVATA